MGSDRFQLSFSQDYVSTLVFNECDDVPDFREPPNISLWETSRMSIRTVYVEENSEAEVESWLDRYLEEASRLIGATKKAEISQTITVPQQAELQSINT